MEKYTKPQLLTAIFNWAYKNDKKLYHNLDSHHSAHSQRNLIDFKSKELLEIEDFDVNSLLTQAISISDYQDNLKFNWSFGGGGLNCTIPNVDYNIHETHEYSFVYELIKERFKVLESLKLNKWNRSNDHLKWKNFRYQITKLKDGFNNGFSLGVCQSGDSVVSTLLNFSNGKTKLIDYILNNHIVPDPHYSKVIWNDPINPDYKNPRIVRKLTKDYLIYLSADELLEVKKQIIVESYDRPEWAYIIATAKHRGDIKFFIKIND